MHDQREDFGAAKLAWEMFRKTGSISYYMLYKELLSERGKKRK